MSGLDFDDGGCAEELARLSQIRFDAVVVKNMTEIYNRGQLNFNETGQGTPVRTGELRMSMGQSGQEVGYTKDYGPHVEYGHRTVTGGWMPGRRFLKRNVDTQRPIFIQDLRNQLRRF